LRREYGIDIERQLVNRFREKGAFAERRPGSLGATDVLRIYDNEIWVIQSKCTSHNVLYINDGEIKRLINDKARIERNLSKAKDVIKIKAIFYVAKVITPKKGQKARRIERFIEVTDVKGRLKVQFEPFNVSWIPTL
jgi:Holliday junction resolvase